MEHVFNLRSNTCVCTFIVSFEKTCKKTRAPCFITGSKHLETNESSRPMASCFHLSLGVWNPWWSTCPRSWHISSSTLWLQTSQRFFFSFLFFFYFFLDRWQVKVSISIKFPAEVDSLCMYIFKRFGWWLYILSFPGPPPKSLKIARKQIWRPEKEDAMVISNVLPDKVLSQRPFEKS